MVTFDQSLFDLYEEGEISYQDALHLADSRNEVRWSSREGTHPRHRRKTLPETRGFKGQRSSRTNQVFG